MSGFVLIHAISITTILCYVFIIIFGRGMVWSIVNALHCGFNLVHFLISSIFICVLSLLPDLALPPPLLPPLRLSVCMLTSHLCCWVFSGSWVDVFTSFIYLFVSLKSLILFTSKLEFFVMHFPNSGGVMLICPLTFFVFWGCSLPVCTLWDSYGSCLFCFFKAGFHCLFLTVLELVATSAFASQLLGFWAWITTPRDTVGSAGWPGTHCGPHRDLPDSPCFCCLAFLSMHAFQLSYDLLCLLMLFLFFSLG